MCTFDITLCFSCPTNRGLTLIVNSQTVDFEKFLEKVHKIQINLKPLDVHFDKHADVFHLLFFTYAYFTITCVKHKQPKS